MADPIVPTTPVVSSEPLENTPGNPAIEADASNPSPTIPKTPEPAKGNRRRFKLKVDGKEYDEEVDLDDNDFLTKQFQLSKVSQKRMAEAASLEREVKQFIEELRKNPRKVLSDPNIGVDIKRMAADVIEEEIANSQKSPELLAKEKLEAELQDLKDAQAKEREDHKTREFQRIQAAEYQRYDMLMSQALEKSDLPKSPYTIKKMADYMLIGLQNGIDVTPDDVLPLVRAEIQNDLKEMFAVMPEEVIEKIIGKDVFTKVRKKNLATGRATPTGTAKVLDAGGGKTGGKKEPVKKQSFREYFKV